MSLPQDSVIYAERMLWVPAACSPKSKRERFLPLPPDLIADLTAIRSDCPLLFPCPHWPDDHKPLYNLVHFLAAWANIPRGQRRKRR